MIENKHSTPIPTGVLIKVADSEAYQTSLVFYNAMKLLAFQDVSGAKAVYEELKKFFHKTHSKIVPTIELFQKNYCISKKSHTFAKNNLLNFSLS
jgi:hypothetical protein